MMRKNKLYTVVMRTDYDQTVIDHVRAPKASSAYKRALLTRWQREAHTYDTAVTTPFVEDAWMEYYALVAVFAGHIEEVR